MVLTNESTIGEYQQSIDFCRRTGGIHHRPMPGRLAGFTANVVLLTFDTIIALSFTVEISRSCDFCLLLIDEYECFSIITWRACVCVSVCVCVCVCVFVCVSVCGHDFCSLRVKATSSIITVKPLQFCTLVISTPGSVNVISTRETTVSFAVLPRKGGRGDAGNDRAGT